METFENVVGTLNDLVWVLPSFFPFMVAILLSFGIFITLRLGFVQIRKFKHGVFFCNGKNTIHPTQLVMLIIFRL